MAEAKKENAWSMIKLGLVLSAYAVVACAMLAVVNNFTAPQIAKNQERKVSQAIKEFFPESGLTFETINDFTPTYVNSKTTKIPTTMIAQSVGSFLCFIIFF